jgi:hypothetical protein
MGRIVKTILDEGSDEKGVWKRGTIFLGEIIKFTPVEGPDAFESQRLCLGKLMLPELRINPDQKSAFLFPVCNHMTMDR